MARRLHCDVLIAATLALGIAFSVAVAVVAFGLLFAAPSEVNNPKLLFRVDVARFGAAGPGPASNVTASEFERLRGAVRDVMIASGHMRYVANARAGGTSARSVQVSCLAASSEYWSVMQPKRVLGRLFNATDVQSRVPVVVVSERLRRRVGDAPIALSSALQLNGVWHTVIGVLPAGFQGTETAFVDAWVPLGEATLQATRSGTSSENGGGAVEVRDLEVTGRLRAGHGKRDVEARIRDVLGPGTRMSLKQPKSLSSGDHVAISMLTVSLQTVGIFLGVIAVANAAGLTVAEYLRRRREFAMRVVLGCTRGRLVRQLLMESLTQGLLILVLAIPLASLALKVLLLAVSDDSVREVMARANTVTLPVVVVSGCLSALVCAVSTIVPAMRISGFAVAQTMPALGTTVAQGLGSARRRLIAVQTALAVSVLMLAGLLIRTTIAVRNTPSGMDIDGVRFARIQPLSLGYDDRRTLELEDRWLTALASARSLEGTALCRQAPLQSAGWAATIEDVGTSGASKIDTGFNVVSANYFRLLRIPMVMGRAFGPADRGSSVAVAIVNRTLAERMWGAETRHLGTIRVSGESQVRQVVGIVEDAKYTGLGRRAGAYLYLPIEQPHKSAAFAVTVLIRPDGNAGAADKVVQDALAQIDPNLALSPFADVGSLIDRELRLQSMLLSLVLLAAGGALILVAMGLHSSLRQAGESIRKEIGIRLALGATQLDIHRVFAVRIGRSVAVGIAAGWTTGWLETRVLASILVGVSAVDPWVTLGVLTAIGLALLGPSVAHWYAWRTVSPSDALRSE